MLALLVPGVGMGAMGMDQVVIVASTIDLEWSADNDVSLSWSRSTTVSVTWNQANTIALRWNTSTAAS
jgi:hypothetical protein